MKHIKIFLLIILVFLLILSSYNFTLAYNAENTLYYNGKDKKFTYIKDNNIENVFKNLVPGDEKEFTLKIKSEDINIKTNMYLNLNYNSQLFNKIKFCLYKNNELIYDETKKDKLVKLHNFNSDDEFILTFRINVPKELGNEIENLYSILNFTFMIEENGEYISVPKTYDDSKLLLNFTVMIISLIFIIIAVINIRKQRHSSN